jgi:hypothetical protein
MAKFKRKEESKRADAILCADLHIRPDIPVCRIDNFFAAMEKKIDFILALSKQHDCPILVAGDLGHKPLNNGWPTWLLEWTIRKFEGHDIIVIPGQHDLPNHRIDLIDQSGAGVLHAAGAIDLFCKHETLIHKSQKFLMSTFPYGIDICQYLYHKEYPHIAMAHMMVIENKPLWPGQEAPNGHQLLKQFKKYNLTLTGDNHQSFTAEYEGRVLVNPGSMMRTTADQINHRPRVYLWYAETNEVEPVYLPIENGEKVISRIHIDVAKERSDRMNAFVTRVKNDVEIELSYETNMTNYFEKYRTQPRVKEKVLEAMA